MKKIIVFVLITLSQLVEVQAQYRWDIGGSAGAANYLGEMGGKEQTRRDFIADIKLKKTRFTGEVFGRYRFKPDMCIKMAFAYVRIAGADNLSTNPGRMGRNLSFVNNIFELSALYEYYFFEENDIQLGRLFGKRVDFKALAFVGIGGFHHNPRAGYGGDMVKLAPLRTEGKKYSLWQPSIPFGAGIVYIFERRWKLGFDWNYHWTFTDYLDDVSNRYVDNATLGGNPVAIALANRRGETSNPNAPQKENYDPGNKRGDPTHDDAFLMLNVSLSYAVKGKNPFYRARYKSITGAKRRVKRRRTRAKF